MISCFGKRITMWMIIHRATSYEIIIWLTAHTANNTGWFTHRGRIYVSVKKAIIGSDNGLSPGRRQTIIWTNDGILLIGTFETNFSKIVIEIHTFPLKKMNLKMSSGKWRPFCPGLNVLIKVPWVMWTRLPNEGIQTHRRKVRKVFFIVLFFGFVSVPCMFCRVNTSSK